MTIEEFLAPPPPGSRLLSELSPEELADDDVFQSATFRLDFTDFDFHLTEKFLTAEEQEALARADWLFQCAHLDNSLSQNEAATMERQGEAEMDRLVGLAYERRDQQRVRERRAAQGGQVVPLPGPARTRSRARAPRTSAGSRARRSASAARAGPADGAGDGDGDGEPDPCEPVFTGARKSRMVAALAELVLSDLLRYPVVETGD
jgi:hypothetical protein